jgi:hypothetical protein
LDKSWDIVSCILLIWDILNEEVLGLSVKDRMDDMLSTIEEAGADGIELRDLVKVYYEKWGYRLSTIKGYVSDLEELEKVRIVGTRIYHFNHPPPRGLVRSTR